MRRLRWVSRHLRCPKVSKGRAESPLLAVTHGNFAVKESLAGGTDAPTPARTDGAAAPRRAVLSFDAKESTKESQRHGDYGKKPFIAHFDGGARNVARNFVGELPPTFARAPVLPFFRRQNGRAFFPSLPNAALLPRSWHRADSNSGAWELQRSLAASQRRETDLIFSFTVGARHA